MSSRDGIEDLKVLRDDLKRLPPALPFEYPEPDLIFMEPLLRDNGDDRDDDNDRDDDGRDGDERDEDDLKLLPPDLPPLRAAMATVRFGIKG